MSKKRYKMSKRRSRRSFSKSADMIHKKNALAGGSMAMRGGIRL